MSLKSVNLETLNTERMKFVFLIYYFILLSRQTEFGMPNKSTYNNRYKSDFEVLIIQLERPCFLEITYKTIVEFYSVNLRNHARYTICRTLILSVTFSKYECKLEFREKVIFV